MVDRLRSETEQLLKKLEQIKTKLYKDTLSSNLTSSTVLNTVALSNEITSELKEILIILHTTMVTEFTETKVSNFDVNTEIITAVENMVLLQNDMIHQLAGLKPAIAPVVTKPPTSKGSAFLKEYKTPISVIMVVAIFWVLTVLSSSAMNTIFDNIPAILKGSH